MATFVFSMINLFKLVQRKQKISIILRHIVHFLECKVFFCTQITQFSTLFVLIVLLVLYFLAEIYNAVDL